MNFVNGISSMKTAYYMEWYWLCIRWYTCMNSIVLDIKTRFIVVNRLISVFDARMFLSDLPFSATTNFRINFTFKTMS